MKIENFIPLKTLVTHYKVELSFFKFKRTWISGDSNRGAGPIYTSRFYL
jgi:hypothetical protein